MSSVQNPFRKIGDALDRMSARERLMVAALGVTLVLCIVSLSGFLIYSGLSDLEDKNAAMRQALREIERKRPEYLKAKARLMALEARIGTNPLLLTGFIEQIQNETKIYIRETVQRTPEPAGKKYQEQSIDVRISKVQLEPLLKFMRKIETHPQNLVLVTQLSIHSLDDKHQEFGVDMVVSTYEHAPKKAPKGKPDEPGAEKDPS